MNCVSGCSTRSSGSDVNASIIISREQLLYDIRNGGYIEGHVLPEDSECVRHMVTDIGEDGNVDRVNSVLDAVYAGVTEMLYPYTNEPVAEGDVAWNLPGGECVTGPDICSCGEEEEQAYVIELRLPAGFSRTTLRLLGRLIHEYMVCKALEDWMSITNSRAADHWRQKGAEAAAEIERVKNLRRGAIRRRISPF